MTYKGQTSFRRAEEPTSPREPRRIQIIISGPCRSGMTTLATKLLELLPKEGYNVCMTSRSSITKLSETDTILTPEGYDVLIIDEDVKYCPHCHRQMKEE